MAEPGLDAAFLEFIRHPDPELHGRIHGFYVPLFKGRRRVVDLACGEGTFVGLLAEAGHDSLGVDSDPGCVARARASGRPVEEKDVLAWLATQPDASVDGLFNAHLVEHMPYAAVLEMYRQAQRVLAPAGVLVTVTPNVRGLYSHLEMFYLHFGHETFYHPHLLSFFAQQAGFDASHEGENPRLASPLFGAIDADRATAGPTPSATQVPLPRYKPELPRRGGPGGGLWWRLKMAVARLVVRPYLDPLVEDVHAALAAANADRARLARGLADLESRRAATQGELDAVRERVDRSFEAYVVSRKAT